MAIHCPIKPAAFALIKTTHTALHGHVCHLPLVSAPLSSSHIQRASPIVDTDASHNTNQIIFTRQLSLSCRGRAWCHTRGLRHCRRSSTSTSHGRTTPWMRSVNLVGHTLAPGVACPYDKGLLFQCIIGLDIVWKEEKVVVISSLT